MTPLNDTDFQLQMAGLMGAVTEKLATLTTMVGEIKDDQKDIQGSLTAVVQEVKDEQQAIQRHNDKVINELQLHFDGRIAKCNEDVMTILTKAHLNKNEVRSEITKAIQASEKRIIRRSAYLILSVGVVLGFIYNYWDPIHNFIELLKGGK